jgi:Methylamine utilisation protein MauE
MAAFQEPRDQPARPGRQLRDHPHPQAIGSTGPACSATCRYEAKLTSGSADSLRHGSVPGRIVLLRVFWNGRLVYARALSPMLLAWEDSQMLLRALGEVAAGSCALLFLAAALGKLDSWEQWSRLTKEIPAPAVLGRAVRVIVPAVESVVVVLSFAWPAAGLASGTAVLAVFALAVWLLARRLPGRECGCFGAIAPATIGPRLAVRNAALAIVAAAGWYLARQENLPGLSLGQVLVTVLAGAIALMIFQYRRLRRAAGRPASSTPEEGE